MCCHRSTCLVCQVRRSLQEIDELTCVEERTDMDPCLVSGAGVCCVVECVHTEGDHCFTVDEVTV